MARPPAQPIPPVEALVAAARLILLVPGSRPGDVWRTIRDMAGLYGWNESTFEIRQQRADLAWKQIYPNHELLL
jgi:hypothetical protein